MNNLFLFTGQESYLLRAKLSRWRSEFIAKHGELNLSTFDGTRANLGEFENAWSTMPFLGEKRLIIIESFPSDTLAKESIVTLENTLVEKLPEIPESSVVVFVSASPDKRRRLYKWLKENAKLEEFHPLAPHEITKWVAQEAKEKNLTLTPQQTTELVELVGTDLWALHQEISKLALLSQSVPITTANLAELVHKNPEADIFALTDALSTRNHEKILHHFQQLLDASESPQQIFYMLARQVRLLLMAQSALVTNPNAPLATTLKVHPFVASKLKSSAQKFSLEELRKMHDALLEIDIKLKTSQIEVSVEDTRALELAIETFLLRACQR